MTLTAILPSLRATIPDPLDVAAWPVHTEPTCDDVRVSAVSMSRLADVAGTPCVHTAEESPPRYRPRDWAPRGMSVAVAAVTGVRRTPTGLVLELDAVLPDCAVLDEARLIGRRTTAPRTAAVVMALPGVGAATEAYPAAGDAAVLVVPGDVAVGDLVCFPCRRALTHREVAAVVTVTGASR
ncbi:hypothetical protein [Curtobacterium sp. MCSS17_015]|uniref:hypothetical protein n=1 Tax=Curtobacterium sp. MCSS17_015 TaxID=2175666 RepID=UPI000DA94911|nr:hypothetical protein [Curtobacterium sp. MCSS17_015]WIB27211.1 hypothetical protein DEJ18_03695 [Curtobacterium sp. MCSS17_015]